MAKQKQQQQPTGFQSFVKNVKGLAAFTGIVVGGAAIAGTMAIGAAGVGTLLAGTMTAALATKVLIVGGSLGAAGAVGGMFIGAVLDTFSTADGAKGSGWKFYRGVGLSAATIWGVGGAIASFTMGCMSQPAAQKTSLNDLNAAKDFNRVALIAPAVDAAPQPAIQKTFTLG